MIIWGNAAKKYIQELTIRRNNLIGTITFSSKYCHMTVLYKILNLQKFGNVYTLDLAKFMYQLHHNLVPRSLTESFVKITDIHAHKTRQAQNVVYFRPRVKKT